MFSFNIDTIIHGLMIPLWALCYYFAVCVFYVYFPFILGADKPGPSVLNRGKLQVVFAIFSRDARLCRNLVVCIQDICLRNDVR